MQHYIHPNACLQHWQPSHCALQIWCLCQWSRIQCKLDWSPGRWVGIIKYSFYSSACFFWMQHQSFGFCSLIIDFVAGCNILQKCSCCSLNWIEVVTTEIVFDCWQFTTCYLSSILNYKALRVYVYIQYSVGFNKLFLLAGCGGPVTAPSGEIHSPLYPNSYPNNVDCSWVISVDPNHRVFLNFTDLDIEYHSSCNFDYVAVSDWIATGWCNIKAAVFGCCCVLYLRLTRQRQAKALSLLEKPAN